MSTHTVEIRANQASNNLVIAGTLDYGSNRTLTVNGNLSISGTAAQVTGGNNKVLSVLGNLNVGSGTAINFVIDDLQVSGTTTIDGAATFSQNGHDITMNNITVSSTGTWNNNSTGDPIINGNLTVNGAWTGCSTTIGCDYFFTNSNAAISGSSTITISNLVADSPALVTNTGSVAITDLLRGTGTFVNGVNGSLSLQESSEITISTFTATANGNTLTYNVGATNNLVSSTGNTFYNLIVNNASSINHVDLVSATTIANNLTITNGNLRLGNNNLIIADGATMSGGSTNGYIELDGTGVVRQLYSTSGATLFFPIGENTDYAPITSLTITSATFGVSPYLDFTITDGLHPNRNTSNTGSGGDDDGITATDEISRYWTITANNITSPRYDVSYQYIDADVSGTEANMVGALYRLHPSLGIMDWVETGTVNAVNNTVSLTNADAFGDLYAMDNNLERLPVELLSFKAISGNESVILKWVTASEENNDFFSIERSLNGEEFEEIGSVDGKGNSVGLQEYNFEDFNSFVGKSYYRLRQVDFNGQESFSEVVMVMRESRNSGQLLKVYPNPVEVGSTLTVSILENSSSTEYQWTMIDVEGKEVRSGELLDSSRLTIETLGLKSGVYLLKVFTNTGRSETKKLIVR